ncbi:UNVERIFIED_CONTAM: hypothetical protein FKN15_066176 [Acipenser sinensis]
MWRPWAVTCWHPWAMASRRPWATAAADPREATLGGEPLAKKVATGAPLLPLAVEVGAAISPPTAVEVEPAGTLPLLVELGVASSPSTVVEAEPAGILPLLVDTWTEGLWTHQIREQ